MTRKIRLTARAVPDELIVVRAETLDGEGWLEIDIDADYPYRSYKALPDVVEYLGARYVKMSFNSDTNRAAYTTRGAERTARMVR